MKLTNEQIARVFAMYLGCEMRAAGIGSISPKKRKWKRRVFTNVGTNLKKDFVYALEKGQTEEDIFYSCECRLTLTPLSAITDEHAIEVAKMVLGNELEGLSVSRCLSSDNKYISEEVNAKYFKKTLQLTFAKKNKFNRHVYLIIYLDGSGFATNVTRQKLHNIFPVYQYLIQKGYDLPLFIEVGHPDNGKTAIELGLAIDKTKEVVG